MSNDSKLYFNLAAPQTLVARAGGCAIPSQSYRTEFMRDRDRILYCSSFRRLSGKTQIYLTGKDDHRRNRLTHTLEVSQIARTISHALGLDCDLAEAIALGHDLGHTPFGHAGEQILHEIMVPSSQPYIKNSPMEECTLPASIANDQSLFGFKHNVQGVRLAADLESGYGKYGLDLTNFTLWGILHHSSLSYKKDAVNVDTEYLTPGYAKDFEDYLILPKKNQNCCENNGTPSATQIEIPGNQDAWSFEAFVVAQADEIAQWHHDLEDALRGQAMTGSDVCKTIRRNLRAIMNDRDRETLSSLEAESSISRKYIADLSRIVVNTLVNRLVACSSHNLKQLWDEHMSKKNSTRESFFTQHNWNDHDIASAIGFKKRNEPDTSIDSIQTDYPSVIKERIHHSREVERMNVKGKYIIKKLFQAYFAHPQQLPDNIIVQYMVKEGKYKSFESASTVSTGMIRMQFESALSDPSFYDHKRKISLMRKICDHIAGMTDHYAIEEYKSLYN